MALIKRLPVDELAVLIVEEEEVGGRGEEGEEEAEREWNHRSTPTASVT